VACFVRFDVSQLTKTWMLITFYARGSFYFKLKFQWCRHSSFFTCYFFFSFPATPPRKEEPLRSWLLVLFQLVGRLEMIHFTLNPSPSPAAFSSVFRPLSIDSRKKSPPSPLIGPFFFFLFSPFHCTFVPVMLRVFVRLEICFQILLEISPFFSISPPLRSTVESGWF